MTQILYQLLRYNKIISSAMLLTYYRINNLINKDIKHYLTFHKETNYKQKRQKQFDNMELESLELKFGHDGQVVHDFDISCHRRDSFWTDICLKITRYGRCSNLVKDTCIT